MIKPIAFRLARRLVTDPRVQAWAIDQAIKMAPHVAAVGRRAAMAAREAQLPRTLLRRLEQSLQKGEKIPPAPGFRRSR